MENIITNNEINEIVFLNKKEKIEESLRTTYRKKIDSSSIRDSKYVVGSLCRCGSYNNCDI